MEMFEDFRVQNLAAVKAKGAATVVFACPSCYQMWREHYRTDLELLSAPEFLLRLVRAGKAPLTELPLTVTYHDPCDLGRGARVFEEPREVIRAIPGVTLVELPHSRENCMCCGGGGNLEMVDPDLAAKIAKAKIEEVVGYRRPGGGHLLPAVRAHDDELRQAQQDPARGAGYRAAGATRPEESVIPECSAGGFSTPRPCRRLKTWRWTTPCWSCGEKAALPTRSGFCNSSRAACWWGITSPFRRKSASITVAATASTSTAATPAAAPFFSTKTSSAGRWFARNLSSTSPSPT